MTPDKVEAALGVLSEAVKSIGIQLPRSLAELRKASADQAISVLTEALAESRRDAARYRWLRENAGAWEVSRDPSEWGRAKTGEKFRPKVYLSAHSTSYAGLDLDAAIDAAMKETP